jgi:diaminopimelate epimerase
VRFAKYQGIGNDFILVADPRDEFRLGSELVARLCDRRFGIGADGIIRVAPGSSGADLSMDYRNSDGSVGEMCGNGIRCMALFALAEGLASGSSLTIDTLAGARIVEVVGDGRVRVDMGPPAFTPAEIPVSWDGADALHAKLEPFSVRGAAALDEVVEAACLSIGNAHAVLFVDDPEGAPVATLGPVLEVHPAFPLRTNVEFVRVDSPQRISMRVWERGSGETLACGTGACAAAVAARLLAAVSETVTVAMPGGELEVSWRGSLERAAPVLMTGPAERSFDGEVNLGAYG